MWEVKCDARVLSSLSDADLLTLITTLDRDEYGETAKFISSRGLEGNLSGDQAIKLGLCCEMTSQTVGALRSFDDLCNEVCSWEICSNVSHVRLRFLWTQGEDITLHADSIDAAFEALKSKMLDVLQEKETGVLQDV